jgi:hypothetical protein
MHRQPGQAALRERRLPNFPEIFDRHPGWPGILLHPNDAEEHKRTVRDGVVAKTELRLQAFEQLFPQRA